MDKEPVFLEHIIFIRYRFVLSWEACIFYLSYYFIMFIFSIKFLIFESIDNNSFSSIRIFKFFTYISSISLVFGFQYQQIISSILFRLPLFDSVFDIYLRFITTTE